MANGQNGQLSFLNKEKNTESESENNSEDIGDLWFPNMAYGWTEKPSQDNLIFKNATVWTNEQVRHFNRC